MPYIFISAMKEVREDEQRVSDIARKIVPMLREKVWGIIISEYSSSLKAIFEREAIEVKQQLPIALVDAFLFLGVDSEGKQRTEAEVMITFDKHNHARQGEPLPAVLVLTPPTENPHYLETKCMISAKHDTWYKTFAESDEGITDAIQFLTTFESLKAAKT